MTASCVEWKRGTAAACAASGSAGAFTRDRDETASRGTKPGRDEDGLRWRSTPAPGAGATTAAWGQAVERALCASSECPETSRFTRTRPGAGRFITSHLRGSLRSWAPPDSAEPTIRSGRGERVRTGRSPLRLREATPGAKPVANVRRQEATAFRFGRAGAAVTCLRPGRDTYFVKVTEPTCKIFHLWRRRNSRPWAARMRRRGV